jgi:SRSO17 transposase
MDADYGADTNLCGAVRALGLRYAAGILSSPTMWPQGTGPLPPKQGKRPGTRLRRDAEHQPVQVKALALSLPAAAWQTITPRSASPAMVF